jgi:hypothetical protein
MLKFSFVIQDVLFISISLYELFHSNPLCLAQLIVFVPRYQHEKIIIKTHLQSTFGFCRDSNGIYCEHGLQCLLW